MFVEIADHLHRHLAALLVCLLQHAVKGFCGNAGQIERDADEATGFSQAERRCAGTIDGVGDTIIKVPNQNAVAFGERKR